MEVVELKNIVKKEMAIDYRRVYTATAVLNMSNSTTEVRVEMALEHTPLGEVGIKVTLLDKIDYPLIPVLKKIKAAARVLQEKGTLY
jgi:hypothetical protein